MDNNEMIAKLRKALASATPGNIRTGVREDESAWFSIGDPVNGPHCAGDIYVSREDLSAIEALWNITPDILDSLEWSIVERDSLRDEASRLRESLLAARNRLVLIEGQYQRTSNLTVLYKGEMQAKDRLVASLAARIRDLELGLETAKEQLGQARADLRVANNVSEALRDRAKATEEKLDENDKAFEQILDLLAKIKELYVG